MAATPEVYRAAIARLTDITAKDLAALWATIDELDPTTVVRLLEQALPDYMTTYGDAAASFAADWYEEARDEARVSGRFRVSPAQLPDLGRTDALARWGAEPLFAETPDSPAALKRIQGGMQRIVADGGRNTVSGASLADSGARGWQRVGVGHNCPFCEMLIARGAVYTKATADFGAHDHCNCAAMPAWKGQPAPVKAYTPTSRNITDADRARVRDWIRANH